MSTSKLREVGKRRKLCPYFLARHIVKECTVTVAPYQYAFNEHIRLHIQLDLADKTLVFDEAHNADKIGQDVLSDVLSERALNMAKRELEAVNASPYFLDELLAYLERKVSDDVEAVPGVKLYEDLREVLQVPKLSHCIEVFSGLVDEIREYKMDRGEYPISYLNGLLTFLRLVASSPQDSYLAVYKRSPYVGNLVEYRCLDPSLAVKPVVEEAIGALIMSGTLSPLHLYSEILGLEKVETRTYSAIAQPEHVRTIVDTTVTTRFSERSQEMTHRIGDRLTQLVTKIPNGVLIFFPQKQFMVESLKLWRRMGLMQNIDGADIFAEKPLFVEGDRARNNRRVVKQYKQEARSENGAILCGVFRGRNAEGSNFPYEEARGVILIGVPYADYSDPVVRAQIDYFNQQEERLGEKWYVMDAFRAANQAMGRGIRHRDDWCNFILMDYRYQSHQNLISQWAVLSGVHTL
jgi:DNA repair helicase Rad3